MTTKANSEKKSFLSKDEFIIILFVLTVGMLAFCVRLLWPASYADNNTEVPIEKWGISIMLDTEKYSVNRSLIDDGKPVDTIIITQDTSYTSEENCLFNTLATIIRADANLAQDELYELAADPALDRDGNVIFSSRFDPPEKANSENTTFIKTIGDYSYYRNEDPVPEIICGSGLANLQSKLQFSLDELN